MRKKYTLSPEAFDFLFEAQQEADDNSKDRVKKILTAWEVVGQEMGFDPNTVRPIFGGAQNEFTAVATKKETNHED